MCVFESVVKSEGCQSDVTMLEEGVLFESVVKSEGCQSPVGYDR